MSKGKDLTLMSVELAELAARPDSTPHMVRQAGLQRLNGQAAGYPQVVYHGYLGVAMWFECSNMEMLWVKVPEDWINLVE